LKFAILHHRGCAGTRFHYRIDPDGECRAALPESEPGEHPKCIGILIDADADAAVPSDAQMDALRTLLLQLKVRYPDIQMGGHRQIRGEDTTCPGKQFPLTAMREWAGHDLVVERDALLQDIVDAQYRP
tara:strand:- start:12055 stop:12441 length:387 start_codon:yes stop_codon:yes gene_type:complete